MNEAVFLHIIPSVMEYILPGFYTSIQILVLLGIGFFTRKAGLIDQGFQKSVSSFLIKTALPLYFFTNMGRADLSFLKSSLYMPLAAVINTAAAVLFAFAVFSLLPLEKREKRAGIALGAFGNAGYIPISLVEIFPMTIPLFSGYFRSDKAVVLIGIYLFIYSPLLWSVGNYFLSGHNKKFSLKAFLSPPMYGIMAGLLIPVFHIQPVLFNPRLPFLYVYTALEKLGTILSPLILVTLGAMIAGIRLHDSVRKKMNLVLFGVLAVRYLLLPFFFYLLYYFILKPFGAEKAIVFVLFLEFHIPPANNFSTIAMNAGMNEDLTAYTLLVTYILYIVLLPVFLMIFMATVI